MNFSSENMNLHVKDAVAFLTFKELEKIPFVSHAFSTRVGGISSGNFKSMNLGFKTEDSVDNIYENYRIFCDSIGTKRENMSFLSQVHGTDIKVVSEENISELGNFDGSITNIPGITLVTFHADCVPLIVVDVKTKSVGLAHAGWRGTIDNIAKELVNAMVSNFNSNIDDMFCFIGPSIHKCCFEVKDDVAKQFENSRSECTLKRDDKIYADISEYNKLNFVSEGIKEDKIIISDLCTKCNSDLLFSYRAQGDQHGIMVSTVSIKN